MRKYARAVKRRYPQGIVGVPGKISFLPTGEGKPCFAPAWRGTGAILRWMRKCEA